LEIEKQINNHAVNQEAVRFKQIERRFVYTTPKSYLELLKLYNELLAQQRADANAAVDRLDNGLKRLRDTSDAVVKIEADLKVALEGAEQKKTVAEGIAEKVGKEKVIVEGETAIAEEEGAKVAEIQKTVSAQQASCQADLAKAEPAVAEAMKALDTLDKRQLSDCKGMTTPPPGVDDIFIATMILLASIYDKVPITKTGKVDKKQLNWDGAKKHCLGNIQEYIDMLKKTKERVDNSTFPALNMKEIRPLLALDHFNIETIQGKNSAAGGLCGFVINIVTYYDIVITVEPKRKALAEANATLSEANEKLAVVQAKVKDLQEKLAVLVADLSAAEAEKADAIDTVERGQRKADLANRLTTALAAENERWAINVEKLKVDRELLTGDVLLASAFISYVGPFTKPFRDKLMNETFMPFLQNQFNGYEGIIPISEMCEPLKILTTGADVAQWNSDGLPADQVSSENGAILTNSKRWSLIIDPQLQGIRWLRSMESDPERHLEVIRLSQNDVLRKLTRALENGYSIIIENLGNSLDAVLNPVIQRATIKRGRTLYVKLGDTEVEFHPDFRLYLHTKLSNPHYPPEIQAETTLINFTVTKAGLEDQMLVLVVGKERRDLAELSENLVRQQNGFLIQMKKLEDSILKRLANAKGDITEDVRLIEGLEETKKISIDIAKKSAAALKTQEEIKITSEKYRPVANRTALLFFLMNDLVKIHTYYIYSLAAFTAVFYRGIDATASKASAHSAGGGLEGEETGAEVPPVLGEEDENPVDLNDEQLAARCDLLLRTITTTVYDYVRRGLFVRDKLTVAALLTLQVLVNDDKLPPEDVDYLVASKIAADPGNMGPLHEWLPEAVWPKVRALEGLKRFQGLGDNMQSDSEDWLLWFDSPEPEVAKLPGEYQKNLGEFEKLILLRAMRPDRVTALLSQWIANQMGRNYVEQAPFDMVAAFEESSPQTPFFFVLFPGVDPTSWVENLGAGLGISTENGNFRNISMGQGQEKPAETIISQFAQSGGWVMLQNCHLMQSWVPKLERLLEIVGETAHKSFRCFISAEPPPISSWTNMPESLMQSCIKVANEAPADIKSNLTRAWGNFGQEWVDRSTKPTEFKGCLFALCWFHSIVLGRRRFGQQGWSRKYSFNTGDLTICANVLASYLDTNPTVPWDDLRYIFGEIMYGGHITDAWDRRTANTYLEVLFTESIFQEKELAPKFKAPSTIDMAFADLYSFIDAELPEESPRAFGLHPNAEIGYLTEGTQECFNTILNIGGGAAGEGEGGASPVRAIMEDLTQRLPENFIMVILDQKAKPLLEELDLGPFVVVALQECERMNALLSEMRRSLVELDKGLKGQLNMTDTMEDLVTALSINQWPGRNPFSKCMWQKLAWPSMKNLVFMYGDMLKRITQLNEWSDMLDRPLCLWLPGLFNPTAYLTAVSQVTHCSSFLCVDVFL
jgi:dynein heavy chain